LCVFQGFGAGPRLAPNLPVDSGGTRPYANECCRFFGSRNAMGVIGGAVGGRVFGAIMSGFWTVEFIVIARSEFS